MHENSKLLFERYAAPHFKAGMRVLEIGPDGDPSTYRRQLGQLDCDWRTAELAAALMPSDRFHPAVTETTYRMDDEYTIPAEQDSFDIVLAGQVIEHVRRIWVWLPEVARVTRPGGKVILLSPISWPHHPAPYDCWRIYPDGMEALCADAGLQVTLCEFDALEDVPSKRSYHGVSHSSYKTRRRNPLRERAKTLLGWPLPNALDLITIAGKPA
jgi:SAM-dependent methyltransferase